MGRRQSFGRAAAAVVTSLLLGACGSVVGPSATSGPTTSPPTAQTVSPPPNVPAPPSAPATVSPAPSAPPAISWKPEAGNGAALRDPAGAGSLGGITPFADGFMAVGTDTHSTTIWRGTGTGTWTRLETDRFALAELSGITATSVGLVASGSEYSVAGLARFPSIWTSTDGAAWSTPLLAGDENRSITPVVELAGRLVALVSGNGAPTDFVSSTDGQAWRRVPAPGLPTALPRDLIVSGSRLVAVGYSDGPAAWYSDDRGSSWTAAAVWTLANVPPGGAEAMMTSVAVGPGGLVAVGSVEDASAVAVPAAWHSADGTQWALVARGTRNGRLAAVAHGDGGWVAVGSNDLGDGLGLVDGAPRLGLTTVSGNGQSWTFLAAEEEAEFFSVAASAGGWMTAGRRGADALLWTSGAATARFEGGWPEITPLACPPVSGMIDLAGLLLIAEGKRLACLGGTPVTFTAWVMPQDGRGGTCSGRPTWLTCRLNVPADQAAAHVGAGPTLGVIPHPTAVMPASWEGALPPGTWVQVTGHFDDPAAATCADALFGTVNTPARLVLWCRSQFVATRVTMVP